MSRIDEALKVLERARYCTEHKCSECKYFDKCPDDYSEEEAQPCEDAVSRQAVIEITAETGALETQARVKSLPPVTPKQRTGHWVEIGDEPYDTWECNNCGFVIDGSGCVDPEEYRDIYKYCPNCGSYNGGDGE